MFAKSLIDISFPYSSNLNDQKYPNYLYSSKDISWFWQYTHFILQLEKNTAPLPFLPDIQGSS